METRYSRLTNAIELADPGYVLEYFSKQIDQIPSGEKLPVFDLFLTSGQCLHGTPVKVVFHNHRFLAAIETFPPGSRTTGAYQPVNELTYIDCAHISALRLHDPTSWTHLLSFGNVAAPLNEDPLSRLQAKREIPEIWNQCMSEVSSKLGTTIELNVTWESFPQNGLEFNHLRRLAKEVVATIRVLSQDSLGLEALKKVRMISLTYKATDPLETSFRNGALEIPSDGLGTKVSFDSVKSAIEAAI